MQNLNFKICLKNKSDNKVKLASMSKEKNSESSIAHRAVNKMLEEDHFSAWLGIEVLKIEEGRCHLKLKVRKEMLNGFGILHGGVAFSMADSALAFAVNAYGRIAPLIQGSMNYSKSAKEGDELLAVAEVISLGNKKADVDVNIFCNQEKEAFYFFRGTVYRTSKSLLNP